MKILVTGIAGYIGSILIPKLLASGHTVVGVDNLSVGFHTLLPYIGNPGFAFHEADVRNTIEMQRLQESVDGVIHLAAIVGFPACRKDPELAKEVNLEATKSLISNKRDDQFFIFASTCSNYGARGTDASCTEDMPLEPLSEYGVTKTDAEAFVLGFPGSVALRVATAFGVSPRLRLNLLLNTFVHDAVTQGHLKVYESWHRRSFIHVQDIANAYIFAANNHTQMSNNAYNVGSETLNITKGELANLVGNVTGCVVELNEEGRDTDQDQRDYVINFDKLNKLGFSCALSLEDGVSELQSVLRTLIQTDELSRIGQFYWGL